MLPKLAIRWNTTHRSHTKYTVRINALISFICKNASPLASHRARKHIIGWKLQEKRIRAGCLLSPVPVLVHGNVDLHLQLSISSCFWLVVNRSPWTGKVSMPLVKFYFLYENYTAFPVFLIYWKISHRISDLIKQNPRKFWEGIWTQKHLTMFTHMRTICFIT